MVFVGLAVLVTAAVAGARIASQSVAQASRFRLQALEVRGLRLLDGDSILTASGVEVGAGLFSVDLDTVAARLRRLVWVRSARVERKPPDRLIVHLEERRRVVWVEWAGRLHGLDAEGVLLPPDRLSTEGVEDLDLPVLHVSALAAEPDSLGIGHAVSDSTALSLLAWMREATARAPELTAQISEISALDDGALRLRMVADDLEVRVPFDRVGFRLATLGQVLSRVYRECPSPVYVDLRFEGQAVVGTTARRPAPTRAAHPRVPGSAPTGELGHG